MARQPAPIGVPTPTCSELARCVRRPPRVATRRRPATCAELACWLRRPHRVVIAVPIPLGDHRESGRPPTCSELACWVRRPHRVTIAVPTRPRVTIVVRRPPRVAIDGSNRGRRPPRVAIAGSHRGRRPPRVATRRRPATCSELACCVRRPPRVVIVVIHVSGDRRECGRRPTCSELACCGRRRPRVVIDGSNRGRRPPRVAIAGSNRGFSRLGWSAEPTLLSLSWYKPCLVVDVVGGGGAFLLSTGR